MKGPWWKYKCDKQEQTNRTRLSKTAMADLPALLLASLNPESRKQAEQNLNALGLQHGFLSHLLRLVLDPAQDHAVRLSGSIYLKNITKHRWEEASFQYSSNSQS